MAFFLGGGYDLMFMEEMVEHCIVCEAPVVFMKVHSVDVALEAVPSPAVCVLDSDFVWPCDFER